MADKQDPTWTVVSQVEDFGPTESGTFSQGVRVTFRTRDGDTGSVFIPAAEYTVARTRELIDRTAQAMVEVRHLEG